MTEKWTFQRNGSDLQTQRIGSILEGWTDWKATLADGPSKVAEIFCREHVQNFLDAANNLDTQETPHLEYRFVTLTGDEAHQTSKEMGLLEMSEIFNGQDDSDRLGHRLPENKTLNGEPVNELRLLIATERYTTGMYGPFTSNDGRSHTAEGEKISRKMRSALIDISGDKGFGTDAIQRGSYGEGKKGVALASKINTLFVYSCFKEVGYDAGVTRRLMGVAYWNGFNLDQFQHNGLATYPNCKNGETGPYENELADQELTSWGIPHAALRSSENIHDLGTTWIFVEPNFSPEDLAHSLERNWWPSICEGAVEFNVIDDEGSHITVDPNEREELVPFISAYNIATEKTDVDDFSERKECKKGTGASPSLIGRLGLIVDLSDGGWSYQDNDETNTHLIATVRQGMIISYFPAMRGAMKPFIRGCFVVADGPPEAQLRYAEPPLHNRWREDAANSSNESAELANWTHTRIRKETRSFFNKHSHRPPRPIGRLKNFAEFFGGPKGGKTVTIPPGPSEPAKSRDPWQILTPYNEPDFDSKPGQCRLTQTAEISLKSNAIADEEEVIIKLSWEVEEGDVADGKHLENPGKDEYPAGFKRAQDGSLIGVLTRDPAKFTWISNYYESWNVGPSIQVRPVHDPLTEERG